MCIYCLQYICITSRTLFSEISGELKYWLYGDEPENDQERRAQERRVKLRTKMLYRLKQSGVPQLFEDNLFNIIGNFILRFMDRKSQPFPKAIDSQENFLRVSAPNAYCIQP